MITRNRRINKESKDVQSSLTLNEADIRRFMRIIAEIYAGRCNTLENFEEAKRQAKSYLLSEVDWRTGVLESHPQILGYFEGTLLKQLSEWCWYQAVQAGYFIESATHQGQFYLTDKLLDLAHHPNK